MDEQMNDRMTSFEGEASTPTVPVQDEREDAPQDVAKEAPCAQAPLASAEAAPLVQNGTVDYAALAEEDLAELKGLFPELAHVRSLTSLHDPVRYGELRDLGLSPREAYLATEGGRRARDNRAHLTGFMPRTNLHTGDSIAPQELAAARELFSGLSDGEIRRLYKRVSG